VAYGPCASPSRPSKVFFKVQEEAHLLPQAGQLGGATMFVGSAWHPAAGAELLLLSEEMMNVCLLWLAVAFCMHCICPSPCLPSTAGCRGCEAPAKRLRSSGGCEGAALLHC